MNWLKKKALKLIGLVLFLVGKKALSSNIFLRISQDRMSKSIETDLEKLERELNES